MIKKADVINEYSNLGGEDTMSVITSDQICNMVREVALTCAFFDPNDFCRKQGY